MSLTPGRQPVTGGIPTVEPADLEAAVQLATRVIRSEGLFSTETRLMAAQVLVSAAGLAQEGR